MTIDAQLKHEIGWKTDAPSLGARAHVVIAARLLIGAGSQSGFSHVVANARQKAISAG
jgi:hypothetical protein